jgi:PAS domain S-box-containing protein
VRAFPSPQGLAIYFRDITDSHSVQRALADSQEQLRNLFENTIDGVLYTGDADEIVRLNPAACAMLARPPSELRGQGLAALVAAGEPRLAALREQRGMTGRASGRLTLVRGDGSAFEAEVSSAEYTAGDGSLRAFVVFRDISRRLRAEQEVRQLNAQLSERVRQRTAELEAANGELKAFAHSLAHDLQSPTAAIDAYTQMLQRVLPQPLPERGAHYLDRIRGAAHKIGEYTQGLLALARVSQAVLRVQRVDLSAVATDLLTQLAERDRDRQVEWSVQPGLHALGDPTLLRMALENLLGNAWKFTRQRQPARIEFAADSTGEGPTVYRVRDNGAGFDMAYAHRLFGNFQRLHSQQEFPGTGIGLANVQRVVTRHGGRIRVEAAEGEGACFYFTLGSGAGAPSVK